MLTVLVDIDDTLVDTNRRRWAAWRQVLGIELPLGTVEENRSREILRMYSPSDGETWERFWRVLLCWEEGGIKLLNLDTPLPHAPEVLKSWSEEYRVIYFTGRSTNMYDLTLEELRRFGFPTENVELVMLSLDDWKMYLNGEASAIQLRSRLFSTVHDRYEILRVIDDIPHYFSIYKKYEVSERIGMQRPKVYSRQEYFLHGATKVVNEWKHLRADE